MNNLNKYFTNNIQDQIDVVLSNQYKKEKSLLYKNTIVYKTFYENYLNVPDDDNISYVLNNDGQRCDNFIKTHKGKHVLFAGCSFTFGESLPYKKNWSGYLYNKLCESNKISGYFCLGYPGAGIDIIINNIYRYCNLYGCPNAIFVLFPESSRKYKWREDGYYSIMSKEDRYSLYDGFENFIYDIHSKIKNLEIFCKMLNISLAWSSWDTEDSKIYSDLNFENYIYLSDKDIVKFANNHDEIDDIYFYTARDKSHPGLFYHNGIANIFLKRIHDENLL